MKAIHERLGNPPARGLVTTGTYVNHKNLLHVALLLFLLADEAVRVDGAVSEFQAARESM
jgi:hypothetical protein